MAEVISQEDLKQIIETIQKNKTKPSLTPEEKIKKLSACFKYYNEKNEFKPGDIVFRKENLKNRRLPNYDEPSIVLEVLKEPIYDSVPDSGNSSFKEPLTLKLGTLLLEGNENRFVAFYYDGQRFCTRESN